MKSTYSYYSPVLAIRIRRADRAARIWQRHAIAAEARDATPKDMALLKRAAARMRRADRALAKAACEPFLPTT